jgi:hypothetical protein
VGPAHSPLRVLLCLTALVAACGAQDWLAGDDYAPDNRMRLRVELYSLSGSIVHGSAGWADGPDDGLIDWGGDATLRAEFCWNQIRLSTASEERLVGWAAWTRLPIRVGYTIWERPVGVIWRNEGVVPDVRAELTAYWWNEGLTEWDRVPLAGRADIVAGVDMLGVGVELAAGVVGIQTKDGHLGQGIWYERHGFSPNLELRLRFGTYAFDLSGD